MQCTLQKIVKCISKVILQPRLNKRPHAKHTGAGVQFTSLPLHLWGSSEPDGPSISCMILSALPVGLNA